MDIIKLKLGKIVLYLALDMYAITVFNREHELGLKDLSSMYDDMLLCFELFHEGCKRGAKLSGKEYDLDIDDFGALLSSHPKELKKCFDKYLSVMKSMLAVVNDTEDIEDGEDENSVKKKKS